VAAGKWAETGFVNPVFLCDCIVFAVVSYLLPPPGMKKLSVFFITIGREKEFKQRC